MHPLNDSKIVAHTRDEVARHMQAQGAGHGMDHVLRVQRMANIIRRDVGGDKLVIDLASLLHDIGDAKFHDGVERGEEFSRIILGPLGLNEAILEKIVHIVKHMSFRVRDHAEELSLEGKVVQDADRLDALGAIGIVRTIEFGAWKGQPFYDPDASENPTGMQHFHDKLFRLREAMHTHIARKMAKDREQFMRRFLEQYLSECDLTKASP